LAKGRGWEQGHRQQPAASRQTAAPCKSLYQINELIKIRLAITVLTISGLCHPPKNRGQLQYAWW